MTPRNLMSAWAMSMAATFAGCGVGEVDNGRMGPPHAGPSGGAGGDVTVAGSGSGVGGAATGGPTSSGSTTDASTGATSTGATTSTAATSSTSTGSGSGGAGGGG